MASSLHPRFPLTPSGGSPSASSTPVHSIQTLRRKSAGHHGPLTKILVANRGVRHHNEQESKPSTDRLSRKSLSEYSEPPMSWQCTPSLSSRMRIACRLTDKRLEICYSPAHALISDYSRTVLQADEAYQVGKGLTPVGAYLAQDDIVKIALEHGVDMIHPG
jgi:pyruvate carboxylase